MPRSHSLPTPEMITLAEKMLSETFGGRIKLNEELGHLEAIGATVKAIAAKLRTIWSSDDYIMDYYPAFR